MIRIDFSETPKSKELNQNRSKIYFELSERLKSPINQMCNSSKGEDTVLTKFRAKKETKRI